MSAKVDLKGLRFGRLIVIKDTGKRDGGGNILWLCQCNCGNLTRVRGNSLRSNLTRSCGCLHDELFEINRSKYCYKHGDGSHGKRPKLYKRWLRIIGRCGNPNNKDYKYYGGKGIGVYKKWKEDYVVFKNWALANGYRPSLILDRINGKGNYEPSNCQWVTNSENSRKTAKLRFGDRSPRWLGGISFEPYGIEFNEELKERIRKRDNYTCQIKECAAFQNGRKHDVHHIDYNKRNNKPENLTTLCLSCHPRTNSNRQYWGNYFNTTYICEKE